MLPGGRRRGLALREVGDEVRAGGAGVAAELAPHELACARAFTHVWAQTNRRTNDHRRRARQQTNNERARAPHKQTNKQTNTQANSTRNATNRKHNKRPGTRKSQPRAPAHRPWRACSSVSLVAAGGRGRPAPQLQPIRHAPLVALCAVPSALNRCVLQVLPLPSAQRCFLTVGRELCTCASIGSPVRYARG